IPPTTSPPFPYTTLFRSIVGGALLRVGEHLAGLLRLFEELLRLLVVRIAIGVVFHGEAPIRLLDLRLSRCLGYDEYLVVVALGRSEERRVGKECEFRWLR